MPRSPVFIVGSPRSGTSVHVDALLAAGYHGFREGNFLSMMQPIGVATDRHFSIFGKDGAKILVSAVDREALKARVQDVFKSFVDALNPERPWFDKTGNPEMIMLIPVLRRLWPDCVFMFAKRRAIENVVSRLKKFPGPTFHAHCKDWANNMQAWRTMRDRLDPALYEELDQQDLVTVPGEVAARLGALLDLAPEAVAAIERTYRRNRPQRTDETSTEQVLSLDTVGWTQPQKDEFLTECRAEMDAYGYTTDTTYRRAMVPHDQA